MGIDKQIPERAQYIRVIVGEVSRITDHLTCLGASAMELGAFTVFLYALKAREWLFELLEEVCGARLTSATCASAASSYDLPPGFDRQAARHPGAHAHRDERTSASCWIATASSATAWTASASSPRRTALAYGITGPVGALDRHRLRRAQGPPVPGLRPLRLRRAGRLGRRQLRPLRRARRGDAASRCASSTRRSSRSRPAR